MPEPTYIDQGAKPKEGLMDPYESAAAEILAELRRARAKHAPMHSAHEGYAVLLEEVDELWDEVKLREPLYAAMRKEAIQVGAMALAFIVEIATRKDRKESKPCP